jgi:hypothetical protein
MALALKIRKAVVALRPQFDIVGVQRVDTARDAVAMVLQLLDAE